MRYDPPPPGFTRRMLLAQMTALQGAPVFLTRNVLAAEPWPLSFSEIYGEPGAGGDGLAAGARAFAGRPVRLRGFLTAPPNPKGRLLVMTRAPLVNARPQWTDAEWPDELAVIQARRAPDPDWDGAALEAQGICEIGAETDAGTGFVSLLRIVDADLRPL